MSLLVINSSSRVAGGVIKNFVAAGKHSRILCADLFPNYWAIDRFVKLRDSIHEDARDTIVDQKIVGKSSIESLVDQADQIVYITHDYYANSSSKLTMIENVAKIVKERGSKPFVILTPAEYDHMGEASPFMSAYHADAKALEANPEATLIRTDLTFGPDSQFIHHGLLSRISNGLPIYLEKDTNALRNLVHVDDLALLAASALGGAAKGERYFVQGKSALKLRDVILVLEKSCGKKATITSGGLFNPTKDCLVGDLINSPCYKNCSRILNTNYVAPTEYNTDSSVFGQLGQTFEGVYTENSNTQVAFSSGCRIQKLLFD